MRVLLADDELGYATYYADELRNRFGHDVVCIDEPSAAVTALHGGGFQAVVSDLLFDPAVREFNARAEARRNPLTADSLMISGLAIVRAALEAGVAAVVFTTGSQDRQLHMILCYEDLNVRAFCSKRSRGRAQNLHEAVTAVADGRPWIDVILASALPPPGTVPLRETILSGPASKRSVWRALALGARSRTDVEELTGFAPRNLVLQMHDDLRALLPSVQSGRSRFATRAKFNELSAFAIDNSEFFLDDAVREMYP